MTAAESGRADNGAALNGDLGSDLLRQMIREVLAEALPALQRPEHRVTPARPPAPPTSVSAADPAPPTSVPAADPAPPTSARAADPVPPTSARAADPAPAGPGVVAAAGPDAVAGVAPGPGAVAGSVWTVRVSTDSELHDLVLRVLRLADNPKVRRDLISGKARFRLAARSDSAAAPIHRVDKGAVTERAVAAAAQAGARLVLGRRAVLTPLARDSARALGVPIEKEH